MNRTSTLDELKRLLRELGGSGSTVDALSDCPTSDLVLRTPCYFAFFVLEENPQGLRDRCKKAQAEILSANGTKGITWPRDINLVFLISADGAPDDALRRELLDDRHGCRKFILPVNGNVGDALAALPFGPSGDLFRGDSVSVAAGVQDAVRGYDPQLISDLGSRAPGAERIFDKIREEAYSITATASVAASALPTRVLRPSGTKLKSIDITDFRGVRRLGRDEMSLAGDVVFIYGPNGVGKTSIADAVEWAISGQVHRLAQGHIASAEGPDPVVNIFATDHTQVSCDFSDRESITRTRRGTQTERRIGTHTVSDDRAVIDHVVGTEAPAAEVRLRIERLRDLLRGSHLLSQHDIRQFLEQIEPTQRFDILTNMIGADEFVRFREKIATVLRHLNSHSGVLAEQRLSLARNLEDLSLRIRERQQELQRLSSLLTGGETPERLVSELLAGLKHCECEIDDDIFGGITEEAGGQEPELISLRADSAIRSKKVALKDILVGLKDLEDGYKGFSEATSRSEHLKAEIVAAKDFSDKATRDLQAHEKSRQGIQLRLKELKAKQTETSRLFVNLTWLAENLPAYNQRKEASLSQAPSLERLRLDRQAAESAYGTQKQSLDSQRQKLQELEHAAADQTSKSDAIRALLAHLPSAIAKQQQQEQALLREKTVNAALGELRPKVVAARTEMSGLVAKLNLLQRKQKEEASRHDTLSSFLADIGELIRSAECPLCGRGYASLEEAKAKIGQHLGTLPAHLRDVTRQVDEAKQGITEKQTLLDSMEQGTHTLESEIQEIVANRVTAAKEVQSFVHECAESGVNISVQESSSWQGALEKVLSSLSPAPILAQVASLKQQISALEAQLLQAKGLADGTKQKLGQQENEHKRLADELHAIEAEIVSRGFTLDKIPSTDALRDNRSKVQTATKEAADLLANTEKELAAVESEITKLRGVLKEKKEDEASKDRQLGEYVATISRYLSQSDALGVDAANLSKNVSVARSRATDLDNSLNQLEGKRQVLQQVAGLNKLKSEVENLVRSEDEQKRKLEASKVGQSRWGDWVARVEGLQRDVTRGQMDVVSTHLERLEPTAQRLYQRMNPHPLFGNVRIVVDEQTRKLDIQAAASLDHEKLKDIAVSPSVFFSDAQLNSLAITVFLAGALRQRWSGLSTIVIDDPVQQMDEMNVYAFLDLIRGLSSRRQFIVFTCNRDFYLLALEKLECLNKVKQDSFLAYRLEGVAPSKLRVHCDSASS